jgi:signal transduction histidine kinase
MALLAGTLTFTILNRTLSKDAYFALVAVAMILGYSTVGAVLASRTPRNAIGWLMIAVGLSFALTGFTSEYIVYAFETNPGSLPFGRMMAVVSNSFWLPMFASVILLVLLFPTGRVPGPRWRRLPMAVLALTALALAAGALMPGELQLDLDAPILNPIGVDALRPVLNAAATVAWIGILLAAAPLSITALVVRYRRSKGEERQQMRWLAYVAGTTTAVIVAGIASAVVGGESFGDSLAADVFVLASFGLVGVGVPVAMGVSVLRYRLYELDVVIKKTVVFGLVAFALTLLALLVLLVLPIATVGTGLSGWEWGLLAFGIAIGLLFGPLRRRARRLADRIVYRRRATPYEVLTTFSERIGETYSTEDVLPRMVQVLASGTGATSARVLLRVGGDEREVARWPHDADPAGDEHVVPVVHLGEELGALAVRMPANDPMDPAKEKLVADLAAQTGLVLRNVRLIADLRASRQRLVAAQDEERRRLERNIHDGAQQQLVALQVKQRLVEGIVERDPARAKEMLSQLQDEAAAALEDLRDLARGIYPPLLADKGLPAALEAQARKSPVPVAIDADGVGRLPQEVEAAVYFSVLEALQNISKYAEARQATVTLRKANGKVSFEVADDGRGFDPEAVELGTGLRGMVDRIEAIGGELVIDSSPGRGTTIRGIVAAHEAEA